MVPLGRDDPTQVGVYQLLGRLGTGGMGQVFLGRSPGGRKVAVKLMRTDLDDPRFRARFAREVDAARRVGGFHTAQVVDADPGANPPWMVTAYISGPSLDEAVAVQGPLTPDGVRELGAGLAEGLAAIHACGLVHRDLKPSNVIMAEDGPRIIDFGIARALDVTGMTQTGGMLGTIPYMSPEQFDDRPVEGPSDVFSLGGVLTFAACGRPPFGSGPFAPVVHRIVYGSSYVDVLLAGHELHGLISACLAKNPADRPTTADLIARLSPSDGPSGTAAKAVDPLVPMESPSASVGPDVRAATTENDHGPGHMVRRRAVLAGGLGAALVAVGVPVGRSLTHRSPPRPGPKPSLTPLTQVTQLEGSGRVRSMALNGKSLAVAYAVSTDHSGATVDVWNLAHRPSPTALSIDVDSALAVEFHPAGSIFATGGVDGLVELWDVGTQTLLATDSTHHTKDVDAVAFHPEGGLMATGSKDKTVRLWIIGSLAQFVSNPLRGHTGAVFAVAFNADGSTLFSGGDDTDVWVWDVPDREYTRRMSGHTDRINSLACNADGTLLASASSDKTVILWDIATSRRLGTLRGHTKSVRSVAFSPDGKQLVTGSDDQTIQLWNTASRASVSVFGGHAASIGSVVFSSDGRIVISGGDDQSIRLWPLTGH